MFNLPSIRIGRVFGIPLEVNLSWLVIFVLVVFSLAFGYFPASQGVAINLVSATITALLFFASILAHEISHSLVARAGGVEITRVTLFIFGGVAQMEEEPRGPGRELLMALAGPGMSLVLAATFFLALSVAEFRGAGDIVTAPLSYLSFINFYVAVFNLLPGFPLDGGRVLRAAIWAITGDLLKATRWASIAGQVIGYSMVLLAAWGVFGGNFGLVWLGLVGWFISALAEGAYRQQVAKSTLHGYTVKQLMSPDPALAPGDISLEDLAHGYLLGGRHSRYPVLVEGEVVGLISLSLLKDVARDDWRYVRVADVADRDLATLLVDSAAPGDEVFSRLSGVRPGALLVVESGRLVGIVTRADVVSRMRAARL